MKLVNIMFMFVADKKLIMVFASTFINLNSVFAFMVYYHEFIIIYKLTYTSRQRLLYDYEVSEQYVHVRSRQK